jgi:4a-hydroxytetrahydrobiopterin dehydratase
MTRIVVPKGWAKQRNALVRIHKFESFADAVAFVVKLGFYADCVDHHPDLKISYRTVTIEWTTHDAGGITRKDVAGAKFTSTLIG